MGRVDNKESIPISISNPQVQTNRNSGKTYLYNGSYHFVFVDSENNREYIIVPTKGKLYIDEIAVLQFKDENKRLKDKYLQSLNETQKEHEKEKLKWYQKFTLENEKYDMFREMKENAFKGIRAILSFTGCKSIKELIAYDKSHCSDYFNQADSLNEQYSQCRSGEIGSQFMSAWYGRMYVDASKNITNDAFNKAIATKIFES